MSERRPFSYNILTRIGAATALGALATACSAEVETEVSAEAIAIAARSGIYVAPYAVLYSTPAGDQAAVRPFARVDDSFRCDDIGQSREAVAELYTVDGGKLTRFAQPKSSDGLMVSPGFEDTIGPETVDCVVFGSEDKYSSKDVPTEALLNGEYKIVGQLVPNTGQDILVSQ